MSINIYERKDRRGGGYAKRKFTFEEAQKLKPIIRKTIGYLINTTDECIVLATDLYNESKPESTINTPMIIPWGMVLEWYEFTF